MYLNIFVNPSHKKPLFESIREKSLFIKNFMSSPLPSMAVWIRHWSETLEFNDAKLRKKSHRFHQFVVFSSISEPGGDGLWRGKIDCF